MSSTAPLATVALLGVGRIGIMHARILVAHPRVGRLILADVDQARAAQAATASAAKAPPWKRCWTPPIRWVSAVS